MSLVAWVAGLEAVVEMVTGATGAVVTGLVVANSRPVGRVAEVAVEVARQSLVVVAMAMGAVVKGMERMEAKVVGFAGGIYDTSTTL